MSRQDELDRIRKRAELLDSRPFGHKEILSLLEDIIQTFAKYLPGSKLEEKKKNTKWVCNFGIKGGPLVTVERTHGSRGDTIPQRWRKRMINAVDEILDFVESQPERETYGKAT
jgi:hypothetical protein